MVLSHCAGAWTQGNEKQRVSVALVISWLPFRAFCGFEDPPLLGACLRGVRQSCNLQLLAPGCSNTKLIFLTFYFIYLFWAVLGLHCCAGFLSSCGRRY